MRVAAAAGALTILIGVAAGGAILAQKAWVPVPAPAQSIAAPAPVVAVAAPPVAEQAMTPSIERADVAAAAVAPAPARPVASTAVAQAAPAPRTLDTTSGQGSAAAPQAGAACPGNPNAIGVGRTVEIDTTGGPGFGFEHFKSHDFLRPGEVVLTFDDGPWPKNTPMVLAALAAHCTKAIFFPIGLHATYEPGILKQVAAAGHAIGSHTWSHQDLSQTKGRFKVGNKMEVKEFDPKDEIEKGISAVRWAVGGPTAPYFRFPALRHPPELVTYLGQRNIAIFSTDFDSFDFKMRKPEQVRQAVMAKLKRDGKGIALMHDFQHATAEAVAGLLSDLKAGGYKIVHMKPKDAVKTIASYDEAILKEAKIPTVDGRPTSSVVRTIGE
jgi:peptidoglycan/xylan/chitin deacetylase (PgdA/CDA1 family)